MTRKQIATITVLLSLFIAPPLSRAQQDRQPKSSRGEGREQRERNGAAQRYSIEQAISDKAQLHTIAFSGLAFVTGDFGASSFLPPGKVCDYFGFQYLRDIDAQGKGHNPVFLNRVAGNVLSVLDADQRRLMEDLARTQAPLFDQLAIKRLPVIKAFHRNLEGDLPAGSTGLNEESVARRVGELFTLDAQLSFERAELYGKLLASLSPEQKETLGRMKFGDFATWPDVDVNAYKLPRGTEKRVNVAYMTYASEFFSWTAGSVEADTYFCPERHGTYFGGFYMKDMPAMGKRDFDISTSLTGDSGAGFLDMLSPDQRFHITSLIDTQRADIRQMVELRRKVSVELRKFISGEPINHEAVLELGRRYGELDGKVSCKYAIAFGKVGQTLTPTQRNAAVKLRNLDGYTSAPVYIYSAALKQVPEVADVDALFFDPPAQEPGRAEERK